MSKEVLDKQVGEWRKEIARLKDLIAHATGTEVAANKAAEEGELPALPPNSLHLGYSASDMRKYARQAIAADRASRQVANKAEVEPVVAAYVNFETLDCVIGFGGDRIPEGYWPVATIPFATPPATTGGANATPTGASTAFMPTVLTDERISAGARWLSNHQADACGVDREDNWKVYGGSIIEEFREACAVAFGTPVAAQAGQVAVPEKKHE